MATPTPSEEGQPVPQAAVQQSMLQQAQAAAAAQTDPARPSRQEALPETTELITSDAASDDIPPPAYGDIYGQLELRSEKDGVGTGASVTNDGRVDIRINQFNRRLTQIFTPAIREHIQSVQDSRPPPAYIPPSLGGDDGVLPPPRLNVVIQVVGSRGDVQPFVALGKVLKDMYGHRVRLATHPTFKDFVQENGLEFFSIGGDPSQLMAFMVKNPGLMPGFRSLMSGDVGERRRDVAEYIQGCWRSCYKAGDGMSPAGNEPGADPTARPFVADCIIANPPSFAHIHCAEKLGIPLHIMFTMPYSPTQAFPHPLANIQSSNADPQLTNYISYAMIEMLAWQGLGDIINRFRIKCLGLDPVSLIRAPGMLQRLKIPHTYCWSPALIPKPKDWGTHLSISGFYFLNLASNYTPAPDLQAFLDAGIVLADPNAMTELIFEAVKITGQRVLLSKGWGGIGADDGELRIPDSIFMLGNVPHDWLFQQVSCVVHHGGAGTTAAGITAGRPTLIVPFFGDQPFWGAMVARAGAGPDPIPHKQLTAANLADAITFCLKPESVNRAKDLARQIAAERGTDTGAQSFHQHLEVDRLRCTLAPSRPATWRIKRTKIRLSAFAACTLANAKLLDFQDLKLYRPREYATDDGPVDPISGFSMAALQALGTMAVGVADVPTETLKAFRMTAGSSRQQSGASGPTTAGKSETSSTGGRSSSLTSPEQSQTNLSAQESLARVRSAASLSDPSSPAPSIGSKSESNASQGQSGSKHDNANRSGNRSRVQNGSGSDKDYDMMRPTGAHTSKGFGRIAKAALDSPMDLSLWGDDTVRPQERVTDFKSGARAVGKEFGFGWYDGVTGLVTQPWKGGKKAGASGFFKGLGKGIGGVPAYMMKGVYKEVEKRVAQGYEEWLLSGEAEKEDVVVRWKMVGKYLKIKMQDPDEMVRDVLEAQRRGNVEGGEARWDSGRSASFAPSVNSADAPAQDPANTAPEELLRADDINETDRLSVLSTSRQSAEENADSERAIQEDLSQLQLQRQQQETADQHADVETLRQAMALSEAAAQRHTSEALEYETQLKRAMAQSLREQSLRGSSDSSEWVTDMGGLADDEDDEHARSTAEKTAAKAAAETCWPRSPPGGVQRPPPYDDQSHLAGTTQRDFEARRRQGQGEKSTLEKTEEEIVMEYVKKQSLLEAQHRDKGKGRVTATATAAEDRDDEELQRALELRGPVPRVVGFVVKCRQTMHPTTSTSPFDSTRTSTATTSPSLHSHRAASQHPTSNIQYPPSHLHELRSRHLGFA
ncbi:hypothetical protein BDV95DRAFT_625490 [Massariosphaeria phaeospora]|uniref:Uncharacterized protein n=1 Tax=Massariosphaeria phaeospora TaxID=100035 RepID=A0A7C8IFQ8_9PLEO|nr:hypothetical protein BDV95DRAFT_625490 [Massariosphaeria phaeospora]